MLRGLRQLLSIPEVDKYSDEQYERLIIQARIRRGDAIWVLPLGAGLLAAGMWMMVAIFLGKVVLTTAPGRLAPIAMVNTRWLILNGVVMMVIFLAATIGVRWLLIVRSIRNILNRAGCPFCDFSLVGLKIEHGRVKCPECGSSVFLHEHRLNADDLIPESQKQAPLQGAGPLGAYQAPASAKPKRSSTVKAPSRR